ncbi:hypothetical protein J6W20_00525 [bacterium]|nr:hypothetical protein [bacterium]
MNPSVDGLLKDVSLLVNVSLSIPKAVVQPVELNESEEHDTMYQPASGVIVEDVDNELAKGASKVGTKVALATS